MTRDEVAAVVLDCVRHTLGLEPDEEIDLLARLVSDLGFESLDFMDLIARVGRRVGVPLRLEDLDDALRATMTQGEFEQGLMTPAAARVLVRYFPDVPPSEIHEGMPLYEIPFLMSPKTLVDFAMMALERAEKAGGPPERSE